MNVSPPSTVSVCMTTYNGENYILEQINSILSQLSLCDELVINDDGSTDSTISLISGVVDSRIKLEINSIRLGYTKNFERSLRRAKGDLIFLSDQDDVWFPNKLNVFLEVLEDHDFVVSDCSHTNQYLSVTHYSHFRCFNIRKGFLPNLIASRYVGSCMAFRRSVLSLSLPFPRYSYFCPHDYWIALVAEAFFDVHLIEHPCMFYRRHSANTSLGGAVAHRPLFVILFQRFYAFLHIIFRLFRRFIF